MAAIQYKSTEKLKTSLVKTINHLTEHPESAKVTFSTTSELVENVKVKSKARDFEFTFDEPNDLGGNNSSPNPVEYLLASLGACQEILYGAYASVLGIPLDSVKVEVKGNLDLRGLFGLDSSIKAGLHHIHYETTLTSPAEKNVIDQLVETVEQNCPVLDTLLRPVAVTGNVIIQQTVPVTIQ